jgi:hypothetical protein
MCIRVITDSDMIIPKLKVLQVGQVALLQCDRLASFLSEDSRTGYRFRKMVVFDDNTSQFKMRDKNDQTGMIGKDKSWYESCFSNDSSSLDTNIDAMLEHDSTYWHYPKLVIFDYPDEYFEALIELQKDAYKPEFLEAVSCEVYKQVKEHLMYKNLDDSITG